MGTAGIWQFEVEQNDLPDSSTTDKIEYALSFHLVIVSHVP